MMKIHALWIVSVIGSSACSKLNDQPQKPNLVSVSEMRTVTDLKDNWPNETQIAEANKLPVFMSRNDLGKRDYAVIGVVRTSLISHFGQPEPSIDGAIPRLRYEASRLCADAIIFLEYHKGFDGSDKHAWSVYYYSAEAIVFHKGVDSGRAPNLSLNPDPTASR